MEACKRLNDDKFKDYFQKQINKIQAKHPAWTIAFDFSKQLLHKRCVVAYAKDHIQRKHKFIADIRNNWKREIKDAIKFVERFLHE